MEGILGVAKWLTYEKKKAETKSPLSKKAVTSKQQPPWGKGEKPSSIGGRVTYKYVNVDAIKWTKDWPKEYERGKNFQPN